MQRDSDRFGEQSVSAHIARAGAARSSPGREAEEVLSGALIIGIQCGLRRFGVNDNSPSFSSLSFALSLSLSLDPFE